MKLNPMQYKDFVWPHNPRTVKMAQQRNIKELCVPFGGSVLQDYGGGKRIVTGEGEFFGEDCMENFLRLSALLKEGGAGYLSLPGMTPFLAVFHSLELLEEPQEDMLRYTFTFWEEQSGAVMKAEATFHIVCAGETLWSIAADYNTTVDALLQANSGIKRPEKLYAGQKVVLA